MGVLSSDVVLASEAKAMHHDVSGIVAELAAGEAAGDGDVDASTRHRHGNTA